MCLLVVRFFEKYWNISTALGWSIDQVIKICGFIISKFSLSYLSAQSVHFQNHWHCHCGTYIWDEHFQRASFEYKRLPRKVLNCALHRNSPFLTCFLVPNKGVGYFLNKDREIDICLTFTSSSVVEILFTAAIVHNVYNEKVCCLAIKLYMNSLKSYRNNSVWLIIMLCKP